MKGLAAKQNHTNIWIIELQQEVDLTFFQLQEVSYILTGAAEELILGRLMEVLVQLHHSPVVCNETDLLGQDDGRAEP